MTIDHAYLLYSFSHFGPSSPLLETYLLFLHESLLRKSSHLNLCIVPETSVVTSTPPPLIQIPSITHYLSSTLPDIATLVIEPPSAVVEDILEEIHLLLDNIFNTPIIPPPLETPF